MAKVNDDIKIGVSVDTEKLQDAVDMVKEATDLTPNITIRNNENVYVTVNNFNTPAAEYYKDDVSNSKNDNEE